MIWVSQCDKYSHSLPPRTEGQPLVAVAPGDHTGGQEALSEGALLPEGALRPLQRPLPDERLDFRGTC